MGSSQLRNITAADVVELFNAHSDIVNFGTSENAVDDDWIRKAESTLGVKLTPSYVWFLKNYTDGEIGGEEMFSIYGIEFDQVHGGGDIVYQYLNAFKSGLNKSYQLDVSQTNFGETFYFDYTKIDGQECPLYLKLPSGEEVFYAKDFYEFLFKRVLANRD